MKKKSNPLVSYIIPSYNHAKYIAQAIESVLDQSYDNIELIIVDDGSSDNSKVVISMYVDNPRVKIIFNEKNIGQSASINKALSLVNGRFVGFLPSDDWIHPEKVSLQMKKFSEVSANVGVIYGRGCRFFEEPDGKIKYINTEYKHERGNIAQSLILRGNFIYPITPLFKVECFDDFPFDESYVAEGESIYMKIALKYEFDYVDEVVGYMRDHPHNTGKMTDLMYEQNLRYLSEYFSRNDLPKEIKSLRSYRIAKLKKIKGMEYVISRGEFVKGRKLLLEATKLDMNYIFEKKFVLALLVSILPFGLGKTLISKLYKRKEKY